MRSLCPIPFTSVTIDSDKNYPIKYTARGYSTMVFSIDYLKDKKDYLVNGIYNNIEFGIRDRRKFYK